MAFSALVWDNDLLILPATIRRPLGLFAAIATRRMWRSRSVLPWSPRPIRRRSGNTD